VDDDDADEDDEDDAEDMDDSMRCGGGRFWRWPPPSREDGS
jgi:hypothetical protein